MTTHLKVDAAPADRMTEDEFVDHIENAWQTLHERLEAHRALATMYAYYTD